MTDAFPQVFAEAGMTTAAPVASPGVLILDDPVSGRLDTGTLAAGTIWADLAPFLISATITRPSTRVQGPLLTYQAGTASAVFDNSDGRLDPDNLAGPYVAAGITQVRPMVEVRFRAVFNSVEYALYSGFADGWQDQEVTYDAGYDEVTLSATDAFKVLAGINLAAVAPAGAGELSGARVNRILSAAGWYTDHRKIAAGDSALQATTLGDSALALLQLSADSEIGELYIDGGGNLVFRNRHAIISDTRSNTPQAVFGDSPGTVQAAGTELAYAKVGRADDDTTMANDWQITRAGGVMQEVTDAASIARYLFPRTYSRSDILLTTDAEALQYASWGLYVSKGGEDRFETLTVDPAADPVNLFPQVLGRQIGDRIQVWRRPQNSGQTVTKDCFIRGISHAIDAAAGSWLTTWTLQDASKYGSFLLLDHPVLGRLDSSALAY